jgi:zinc transport system substrate-binding protein
MPIFIRALPLIALGFLAAAPGAAAGPAAPPGVAASIKPVHSLVAAVMQGIATPHLIVAGAASPHTYALHPSDAEALESADLVFWIGPAMEAFLAAPLAALAGDAEVVGLADSPGLTLLPYRAAGPVAGEHEADGVHADGHAPEDDHDHAELDLHLWLDPDNARVMLREIERALAKADPARARRYAANADRLDRRIAALASEIEAMTAPLRARRFIVFHDAYQYFERRFGLAAAGSVTVSPDRPPGARRIREMHDLVRQAGAVCIFAEPQFNADLVALVAGDTGARTGALDPLGTGLDDGPDLYVDLMRRLAETVSDCLAPPD